MEKLHLEILDKERRDIFQKLSVFRSVGFLSGGTALALQLGHRESYDFDIFCPNEISEAFPAKIKKELPIREVFVNNSDEFTFITGNDVKVSFIFFPFDLSKYVLEFPDAPLKIVSPIGVASTKAYALNRRNVWRDYVDLYIILKRGIVTLDEIVQESQSVFGDLFNEKLFLSQLLYTEDISRAEVEETQMIDSASLPEVGEFFKKACDAYWERKAKKE